MNGDFEFFPPAWLQLSLRSFAPFWHGLFGSTCVAGERMRPRGPLLVACNHASFLDPWFIGYLSPRLPLRFLMFGSWYERSRTWRLFFDLHGAIPTTNSPAATLTSVLAALDRGEAVVVFPEGAVSFDGRIARGRPGIAWMAAMSGAPVIPCALRGSADALPRGRVVPRPRTVEFHVGQPRCFPGAPLDEPAFDPLLAFTADVMEDICRLAGQEDRIPHSRPIAPANPALFTRVGNEVSTRRP